MSAAFTAAEVREALGVPGERRESGGEERFLSVSTDTRTLERGALFVALWGERHDGFDFLAEAAERGARGAVVPAGREPPDLPLRWYPVADPLRALGELAAFRRRRDGRRVVGVTGSSGKTTVKEMLAAALSPALSVYRSPGNLNNQVGLPLSVLEAPAEAEVWVLEMGTNAPGEIARLAEIAAPDDAVVTTVGPAHLEGLGDLHGVLREKLAVIEGARPSGATVVGERPEMLARAARQLREDAVVAGLGEGADFRPDDYELEPRRIRFRRGGVVYRVEAGGEHHLRDALIAAAAAGRVGVAPEEAAEGLASFRPIEMRGDVRDVGGLTVIADCYNANPESFAASVSYCQSAFPGRRRVAVVGSMRELGGFAEEAHRETARRLLDAGFEVIAATGSFREAFRELNGEGEGRAEVVTADGLDELWGRLRERLRGDEVVLVKGSRGERLERVMERMTEEYAASQPAERGGEG